MRGVYSANFKTATQVSTASTLMYLTAPSTAILEILEVHVTDADNNTAAQISLELIRLALGNSPGMTAVTPNPEEAGDQAYTASSCYGYVNGQTEPTTYGVVVDQQSVLNLSGYHFTPLPEDRPTVAPSASIAVKLLAAPAATTFNIEIVFRVIG
jgi:hypothetical protein